jgi:hypothetical protein
MWKASKVIFILVISFLATAMATYEGSYTISEVLDENGVSVEVPGTFQVTIVAPSDPTDAGDPVFNMYINISNVLRTRFTVKATTSATEDEVEFASGVASTRMMPDTPEKYELENALKVILPEVTAAAWDAGYDFLTFTGPSGVAKLDYQE